MALVKTAILFWVKLDAFPEQYLSIFTNFAALFKNRNRMWKRLLYNVII